MYKTFITTAIAFSAVSFASAQDASTTMPAALPPAVTVGDARIDNQIRALHKEMEAKIKAIREEYQRKLKVIIGARKLLNASSTPNQEKKSENASSTPKENKGKKADVLGTTTAQMRANNGATTTKADPRGKAWGFFMRFFGVPKPAAQ
jgi:hypothetical protein